MHRWINGVMERCRQARIIDGMVENIMRKTVSKTGKVISKLVLVNKYLNKPVIIIMVYGWIVLLWD